MRFTATELRSIERTMDKLFTAGSALLPTDSQDYHNLKAIAYIIGEVRLCGDVVASPDRAARVAGYDRLDDLLTPYAE